MTHSQRKTRNAEHGNRTRDHQSTVSSDLTQSFATMLREISRVDMKEENALRKLRDI
jgi:hypothetical protein